MKRIVVLGSTGSIGQQTLDIIRTFPAKFKIVGLAAGNNTTLLKKQIEEFKPVSVYSNSSIQINKNIRLESMEDMAARSDADMVIIATAGKAGLIPTLKAVKSGKKIALANKEVLVMAGAIITREAKLHHSTIIPVDSEHSAIWQCLHGEKSAVSRLLLTASGGPFFGYKTVQLRKVTSTEALNHPTWKMGRKVTIDSATLMNKGLETIEAHWLFSIPYNRIDILVHRQSIIHSMVEFADGSIKAQLSNPDMRFPIQYALSYPKRLSNPNLTRIDFTHLKQLTFEQIRYTDFPCLKLAIDAGIQGGTYPAVLCTADEIAVEYFLTGRINYTEISGIISEVLNLHHSINEPTIDDILEIDTWTRKTTEAIAKKRSL